MSLLFELTQEQEANAQRRAQRSAGQIMQQRDVSSDDALRTLVKYARQFKDHPGKLGALVMVVIEELDLKGDAVARDKLRAVVEPMFGRYVAKAPKVSNRKRAVRQRGREAGDKPGFDTRQKARDFAKDQNQHGKQRQVVDTGRNTKGPRWSAAKTSLRDT